MIRRAISDRQGIGNTLNNIGIVYYRIGQYQRALQYYKRALAIHREIGDKMGENDDLTNIAVVYRKLRQYQTALEYHKQTLEIRRDIGDKWGVVNSLTNIGMTYRKLEQYQTALEYHKQALEIRRNVGEKLGIGYSLNNLGLVCHGLGEYQQAYTFFQNSYNMLRTLDFGDLWKIQSNLASVEVHVNQPESAIKHYEEALDTIEQLRVGLTEKEYKLSFMQDKLFVYDEFIDFLQKLHKEHPNKSYDCKALEIYERKQGRVFLEEMGKSGARRFGGLPENLFQDELDLELQLEQTRKQLVDERSKLITEQNKERIENLEEREKSLQEDQEALQIKIKTEYPDYYALRYPKPVALSDLQKNVLHNGELLLIYGVIKEQTVLWVVSKQDFKLFTINISEERLRKKVEAFRKFPDEILAVIDTRPFEALRLAEDQEILNNMAQQSYELYQRLIPADDNIRQMMEQANMLYIVPTGPLYGLPFEALVTKDPPISETPHYLLHDHPVAYLSSASLLKILRDAQVQRKQTTQYPLLAFANPIYEISTTSTKTPSSQTTTLVASLDTIQAMRREQYSAIMGGLPFEPLPKTEDFVKEIKRILQASDESEPLQLGENASLSTVRRLNNNDRLDDYRYVLFATHAVLPDEVDFINQPAIVLSHPETEEGYLTMADAFGLQLNADLVALSACNTGQGTEIRGEGIIGLTRAFMYAGTPAVGVTLWPVFEQASSELNTRFFKRLKAGDSLAVALQEAKKELLDEDDELLRHPVFWTPFVVFGDGRISR